ncbi:MAG: YkgJ family cysteine cluster protein [Anaerolineae bacterium]
MNITNPLTSSDHPQSPSAAELLCLACGFCCDGTLHTNTVLLPTETEAVAALDMVVEHIGERPAFAQPCAMFRDGRCTIYSQRPQVCRHYECALLKRLLAGEIGLLQALRVVRIAQEQLAVWRGRVPTARSFMGWLKEIEASASAIGEDAAQAQAVLADTALSEHAAALVIYLTRHFGESESASAA